MTNTEEAVRRNFVILASSLVRHSTFVLRHFTVSFHSWLHEEKVRASVRSHHWCRELLR